MRILALFLAVFVCVSSAACDNRKIAAMLASADTGLADLADLSDLILYYKADTEIYEDQSCTDAAEDTDTVLCWGDQSANNLDLTKASGSGNYEASFMNGYGVIDFDGGSEWLGGTAFSQTNFARTQAFTIFYVTRVDDVSTGQYHISQMSNSNPWPGWMIHGADRVNFDLESNFSTDAGSWTSGASTLSVNTNYYIAITYDGAGTTNSVRIWINGVEQSVVEENGNLPLTGDTTTSGVFFSISGRDGGTTPTLNKYAELAIWSRKLTDSEVSQANSYASEKFGIE